MSMEKHSKIFIAGHKGLVGSNLLTALAARGYSNLLVREKARLDLRDQAQVKRFFHEEKIEYVFLAAGKVGGIEYNRLYQADFLYDNLMIAGNVIDAAHEYGIKKLLYLGSSCIYPKEASQPIKEEYLLTGKLEATNEGYALAKIAGLKLCEKYRSQYGDNFISVMPTNLFGPGDNFHPDFAHVIPAMIRRFHEAKIKQASEVIVWGSGQPRREFLHVFDLVNALILLMHEYNESSPINVGKGEDISISELSRIIKQLTAFEGDIHFDTSKPDGTMRKVLDVSRIKALGWSPEWSLFNGLQQTYEWSLEKKIL
jgi:GDP-L-fucose synthase